MLDNIVVYRQSSIKIIKDLIIYFDPFKIKEKEEDADIIFITHDHFDHYDKESILNVRKKDTFIVVPSTLVNEVKSYFDEEKIIEVIPNNSYSILNISFKTIRAYNITTKFHPKENNWVGYLLLLDGVSYYIMGDTDDTVEARNVSCDVLFIPIGGTYTMNINEAATFTNYIKPKEVVPIHYGEVVGDINDGNTFSSLIDKDIICNILIK